MHIWGYLANTGAVILGSILGLLAGSRLPEPLKKIMLSAMGLSTLIIGIQMALGTKNLFLIIGSMIGGGIIGQLIGIEEWLESIGEKLKNKVGSSSSTFVLGFVTASLLFCGGPLTIIGSLEDGFAHKADLIYIKSLLDGASSIALAASLGTGVIFSALTVLIIQGILTYLGMAMGDFISEAVLNEIGAAGGVLILGLGINLLGIGKIKVGNLLPALLLAGLLAWRLM